MILVIGSTGTIGRHVLCGLVAKRLPVRKLVRDKSKVDARVSEECLEGDLRNFSSIRAAVERVDKVFLTCANVVDQEELECEVVRASAKAGVRHIVKVSAIGAAQDSTSVLLRTHAAIENAIKSSGMSYSILRPNTLMQNLLWSADSIQGQRCFYSPLGEAAVSQVDARDVADMAVRLLVDSPRDDVYTVTGCEAITNLQAAEMLSAILGVDIKHVPQSLDDWTAGLVAFGTSEWLAVGLRNLMRDVIIPRGAEVTKAVENVLGRAPTAFEVFLRDHKSAFEAQMQSE